MRVERVKKAPEFQPYQATVTVQSEDDIAALRVSVQFLAERLNRTNEGSRSTGLKTAKLLLQDILAARGFEDGA